MCRSPGSLTAFLRPNNSRSDLLARNHPHECTLDVDSNVRPMTARTPTLELCHRQLPGPPSNPIVVPRPTQSPTSRHRNSSGSPPQTRTQVSAHSIQHGVRRKNWANARRSSVLATGTNQHKLPIQSTTLPRTHTSVSRNPHRRLCWTR